MHGGEEYKQPRYEQLVNRPCMIPNVIGGNLSLGAEKLFPSIKLFSGQLFIDSPIKH